MVLELLTCDLWIARERREAHHCAERVAHVEELRLSSDKANVIERSAQVELRDVVVAVAPEFLVPVRIICDVIAAVSIAAHIAEPYVEAGIGQNELQAKVDFTALELFLIRVFVLIKRAKHTARL